MATVHVCDNCGEQTPSLMQVSVGIDLREVQRDCTSCWGGPASDIRELCEECCKLVPTEEQLNEFLDNCLRNIPLEPGVL